jgi:hypothetical protein
VFTTGRHPDRGSSINHHFAEPPLDTEAQFCSINFQLFVFSLPRVSTDRFGFIADRLDLIRGSSLRKSPGAWRASSTPYACGVCAIGRRRGYAVPGRIDSESTVSKPSVRVQEL